MAAEPTLALTMMMTARERRERTKSAIRSIAQWRFRSVRLPIHSGIRCGQVAITPMRIGHQWSRRSLNIDPVNVSLTLLIDDDLARPCGSFAGA
jgi:hypothetical protein